MSDNYTIYKNSLKLPSNRASLKRLNLKDSKKEFIFEGTSIPLFYSKVGDKRHVYMEVSYFVKKYGNPFFWKISDQTVLKEYPQGPLWNAWLDLIFPHFDEPYVYSKFAPYLYVNLLEWPIVLSSLEDLIFYIYPEEYSFEQSFDENKPGFYFVHLNIVHFFFLYYTPRLAFKQFLLWKVKVSDRGRNQIPLYR